MRFLLLGLIILTQCAWNYPAGWQSGVSIFGSVQTTNQTLSANQSSNVIIFNNATGVAANGTQFTLPSATIGMDYTIITDTAKWIYIQPQAADIINFLGTSTGLRINNKGSAAIADTVELVCMTTGQWSLKEVRGTWAAGN